MKKCASKPLRFPDRTSNPDARVRPIASLIEVELPTEPICRIAQHAGSTCLPTQEAIALPTS